MPKNNNNIMNQNIFNLNYKNNFNSMDEYSTQISNYDLITIDFRFEGLEYGRDLISINIMPNEKISTLIEKFRKNANFYDINVRFIFNAKRLNPNLTIAEAGITNNSNIFVVSYLKLTFKIERLNNYGFPIIFEISENSISGLINNYLDYSGLNRSDIIRFEYNSKILNENKTIKEEGLENDSVIYVITNKKKLKFISILIKYDDSYSNEYKNLYKLKCLMSEKIAAIIETYKNKFDLDDSVYRLKAFLNSEELDKDYRIEETELSNNSTIIIKEKN